LGKYKPGDHVKIEVADREFWRERVDEWMWMLVEESDDRKQLVFGRLDDEPIASHDKRLRQKRASGKAATAVPGRFVGNAEVNQPVRKPFAGATSDHKCEITGVKFAGWTAKSLKDVVARNGVEPPPPAFSGPSTELPKWPGMSGCC
jgi:hypothetical protein